MWWRSQSRNFYFSSCYWCQSNITIWSWKNLQSSSRLLRRHLVSSVSSHRPDRYVSYGLSWLWRNTVSVPNKTMGQESYIWRWLFTWGGYWKWKEWRNGGVDRFVGDSSSSSATLNFPTIRLVKIQRYRMLSDCILTMSLLIQIIRRRCLQKTLIPFLRSE